MPANRQDVHFPQTQDEATKHVAACACPLCASAGQGNELPPPPDKTVIGTPISGDYRIDVLLENSSYRWNHGAAAGTPVTVTYSFMSQMPSYGGSDTGLVPFTTAQKQAVRDIFSRLSSELNIDFIERADFGSFYGQIRFGNNQQSGSAGYAIMPDPTAGDVAGDVWISTDYMNNMTPGSYEYSTLLHEIGHALGLKHPGNYNAGEASDPDAKGNFLAGAEEHSNYSIMSYRDAPGNEGQQRDWFGLYDMLALRYLYGTRAAGAVASQAYTDSIGTMQTMLLDAASIDTLDLGQVTIGCEIDLREGAFSSIGKTASGKLAVDNFSIMYGTVVKNLIATSGADTIVGNAAANVITGGQGDDKIDGNTGIDTAAYATARGGFSILRTAAGYTLVDKTGTAGTDLLSNIERLKFSDTTIELDYSDSVQQLYIAYFGRPADGGALTNFSAALRTCGAPTDIQGLNAAYATSAPIRSLIDAFGGSAESKNLYTGDTAAFVTAVFRNVLARTPNADGLQFWTDAIDHAGLSRGNAALSIMAGAMANTSPQGLLDAALVRNKIIAASNFTLAIDTSAETSGYSGSTAAAAARAMLNGVGSATDLASFQTTIEATLAQLAKAGQASQAHETASFPADAAHQYVELVGIASGVEVYS
ncbi:MAG TPA: M10 family metallopeptidase C-terminal domain-containing protein [Paucimonas sp.]|nr:M10 family metallopeptidase C-terminal domain-containing protein [Paucimonas sp.]